MGIGDINFISVMKVKVLAFLLKDNSFGILSSLPFQIKINEMLLECMNAVHCIQIHQAMDIYLCMYKNILAPEF